MTKKKKHPVSETATPERLSSTAKGRMIEKVVDQLHRGTLGVQKIERNVQVPVPGDTTGRTAEIDVLITLNAGGYALQIAIECKNERRKVIVGEVREFIDKYHELNIPNAVMVSVSGFSADAIERAKRVGLKLRTLSGIEKDGFAAVILAAVATQIFTVLDVFAITYVRPTEQRQLLHLPFLLDREGDYFASVLDFIWEAWVSGRIPTQLGGFRVQIPLPGEFTTGIVAASASVGTPPPELVFEALCAVTGLLIAQEGQGRQFTMTDAITGEFERTRIEADFPESAEVLPVTTVRTQAELNALIEAHPAALKLIRQPVILPRIRHGLNFWPPSARLAQRLLEAGQEASALNLGTALGINTFDLGENDLSTAFEPIWPDYPGPANVRSLAEYEITIETGVFSAHFYAPGFGPDDFSDTGVDDSVI